MAEERKKKKNYVNNADLLKELELSHEQDRMTEELGKMMILLAQRYVRVPRFARYTYTDDMEGFALMTLCKAWRAFDATKSNNPFAYFTQCMKNAFFQFDNGERKQRDIKDEIRLSNGQNPSFNYAERMNEVITDSDASGDYDYMDIHDAYDPYREEDELISTAYDPTKPGEVIELTPDQIKDMVIGGEYFNDSDN